MEQIKNEHLQIQNTPQSLTKTNYNDTLKERFFRAALQVLSDVEGVNEATARAKFLTWWSLAPDDKWTIEQWQSASRYRLRQESWGKNVTYAEMLKARESILLGSDSLTRTEREYQVEVQRQFQIGYRQGLREGETKGWNEARERFER